MRLGAQDVHLAAGSRARALYGRDVIRERHRHRYEFNNGYLDRYRDGGLALTGLSPDGLVEIVELASHPWFLATQFHPEFTSNPRDGHPLFTGFLAAARSRHDAAVAGGAGSGTATVTAGRA
jgi:CTP synthase